MEDPGWSRDATESDKNIRVLCLAFKGFRIPASGGRGCCSPSPVAGGFALTSRSVLPLDADLNWTPSDQDSHPPDSENISAKRHIRASPLGAFGLQTYHIQDPGLG